MKEASPGDPTGGREDSLSTDELEAILVSEARAAGDPTGWFDRLYRAGESGHVAVPWSRSEAQHLLTDWAASRSLHGGGRRAIVVGCALGADAEFVACLGYETTAFDISPAAIRLTRRRHRGSPVHYTMANLLDLPSTWTRAFDLVVEIITVQALPDPPRSDAIANVGRLVGLGGVLVAVALAQPENESREAEAPPWPLSREEIDHFASFSPAFIASPGRSAGVSFSRAMIVHSSSSPLVKTRQSRLGCAGGSGMIACAEGDSGAGRGRRGDAKNQAWRGTNDVIGVPRGIHEHPSSAHPALRGILFYKLIVGCRSLYVFMDNGGAAASDGTGQAVDRPAALEGPGTTEGPSFNPFIRHDP